MAKRKYEHLVKPLSVATMPQMIQDGGGFKNTGNADSIYWLNGRQHLEGLELNFSWGFYTGLGDWHPGMDPHIHPYPEALVFVGLDPNNVEYLGAEISYCLGEELEEHTFDKPTVIIVPAGMPHCPSITKNVTNPIGYSFMIFSLGANPTTTWMGDGMTEKQIEIMKGSRAQAMAKLSKEELVKLGTVMSMESSFSEKRVHVSKETITHGHKYDHFFKPLKPFTFDLEKLTPAERAQYEKVTSGGMKPGPGNCNSLIWMYGKDLEGTPLNFTWGFYKSPGVWHRGPGNSDGAHVHPADEVLVFVGTDPSNIDYLGAEISIDMGAEHERYVFDKPTAVICPKGVAHNPVIARYVDRPYAFFVIGLSGDHETAYVD
jgi:hypothetical protein